MVPPASSELRSVKVLDLKTSVLGNLVPFREKFLPAIRSGHTESSGSNFGLAIGSAIINVNDMLGHNLATLAGFIVACRPLPVYLSHYLLCPPQSVTDGCDRRWQSPSIVSRQLSCSQNTEST